MSELDDISLETLELIEEIMFYQFDEAYEQHRKYDRDIADTVVAYEQALEAVTELRKAKEEQEGVDAEQMELVKSVLDDDGGI